jgi:hypothetical protein
MKTRERHAVREMKEDPSEPLCRGTRVALRTFEQKNPFLVAEQPGDDGGQSGPRGDEDKFVHIGKSPSAATRTSSKSNFFQPSLVRTPSSFVWDAALIPRNKLSPAVIFLVAPTLGYPGTVAVKLGFKDVGRRYPEYRFETCHLYSSPYVIGRARRRAAISAGTICAACGLVAIAAGR